MFISCQQAVPSRFRRLAAFSFDTCFCFEACRPVAFVFLSSPSRHQHHCTATAQNPPYFLFSTPVFFMAYFIYMKYRTISCSRPWPVVGLAGQIPLEKGRASYPTATGTLTASYGRYGVQNNPKRYGVSDTWQSAAQSSTLFSSRRCL